MDTFSAVFPEETRSDESAWMKLVEQKAQAEGRPLRRHLFQGDSTGPLEGIGGVDSGMKPRTKCEERGQYTVERIVLVNSKQELVAVANRIGNTASFRIDYSNGSTTSTLTFSASATGAPNVSMFSARMPTTMALPS